MYDAHREIDHSGDIGVEARGTNLARLIENATRGLFALQYRGTVAARLQRSLSVSAQSIDDLLVDWLNEVIAESAARGELYCGVVVTNAGAFDGGFRASGTVSGEAVTAGHDLRFDVKAATYHALAVFEKEDGLVARVIFDL